MRRNFRTKFKLPLRKIPLYNAFKRLVERFEKSGIVHRSARSAWKRARARRAVAGACYEGSLNKILNGLDPSNIKMSHKIESRNA